MRNTWRRNAAYAGYRVATYHDLKLTCAIFKDTVNLAFKADTASDNLLVLMKAELGIDVENMPEGDIITRQGN